VSAAAPPVPTQLRADPPSSAPLRSSDGAPREGIAPDGRGPLVVRLVACLALALFGAQAWADMVRPEAPGRLVGAAFLGATLGLAVLGAGRLRRRARAATLAGAALAGLVAALLTAGVPVDLLRPRHWDDLIGGLGEGISALPGLSVPYRGVDEWNRIAMLLGGTVLAVLGPLLACWPGRDGQTAGPGVPAVVLSVLYAVPAVQLSFDHPVVDGTIFALLLAAVLFGERLTPRDARAAAPAFAVALLVGALFAPRLDAPDPWLDYESIAQSIGERGTTAFSWDHSYGPLDWPRDGREVLRIRSRESAYWKATTLADFDGLRWRDVRPQGVEDDPAAEAPNPRWVQSMRVSVRNLRTNQFITAGTTLRIERSPRSVVPGAPGSFITGERPLRRGHAYLARVYNPRPRPEQLAAAGSDYVAELWPYLSMQLPRSVGGPQSPDPSTGAPDPDGPDGFVVFPSFAQQQEPLGYYGRGYGERVGREWVENSAYARTYRLAQRLKAESTTPYEYVRRVSSYLQDGFTYTETPPRRPVPIDAFLFRDKVGYCQQFSGAMALLLRMGGVPARVATGFTPGTLDTTRDEYVVRDLDAHSWVEAYFPDVGWMTFDPTPAIAPPRAQVAGVEQGGGDDPAEEEEETGTAAAERGTDPASPDAGAAETDAGGLTPLHIAGLTIVALALAVALVGFALMHRRHLRMTVDDHVRELERALRRSGRATDSALTLSALERRFRGAPDAAAYVRTLADSRYGWGAATPTRAQRAALRRQLAAGLGLRGRLRSLWALPPW
jgi:transglutaminase-like putative cysteine protease